MQIPSLLLFATGLSLISSAPAQISIYISGNDIESAEASGITGLITETFESAPLGSINGYVGAVGTYTTAGGANVMVNDQYAGNGEGKYLGVSSGNSTTLTLTTPASYFGIYFTAGNGGNSFELKSGGTTLLMFNTASLISLLPRQVGTTITGIDGISVYNTIDYYGQPVTGSNSAEPYAYLHIFGNGGTTFDQVVISEALNSATFENDNHSVRATAPAVPGNLVDVTAALPEAGSSALLLATVGAALLNRRRKL